MKPTYGQVALPHETITNLTNNFYGRGNWHTGWFVKRFPILTAQNQVTIGNQRTLLSVTAPVMLELVMVPPEKNYKPESEPALIADLYCNQLLIASKGIELTPLIADALPTTQKAYLGTMEFEFQSPETILPRPAALELGFRGLNPILTEEPGLLYHSLPTVFFNYTYGESLAPYPKEGAAVPGQGSIRFVDESES